MQPPPRQQAGLAVFRARRARQRQRAVLAQVEVSLRHASARGHSRAVNAARDPAPSAPRNPRVGSLQRLRPSWGCNATPPARSSSHPTEGAPGTSHRRDPVTGRSGWLRKGRGQHGAGGDPDHPRGRRDRRDPGPWGLRLRQRRGDRRRAPRSTTRPCHGFRSSAQRDLQAAIESPVRMCSVWLTHRRLPALVYAPGRLLLGQRDPGDRQLAAGRCRWQRSST